MHKTGQYGGFSCRLLGPLLKTAFFFNKCMLSGMSSGSVLGNILTSKGIMSAGEGAIRASPKV